MPELSPEIKNKLDLRCAALIAAATFLSGQDVTVEQVFDKADLFYSYIMEE